MYNPVSTYRFQFNKNFTLSHAEDLIEYLRTLGIKTVYASPIFKATPGSLHGYDVVNPYEVNPEIGDVVQLRKLIRKLKEKGIGWIQDIVPNHMAFHWTNPWLMDVLEKGNVSVYASVFDVSWAGAFFSHRLMVPFLGDPFEKVIQDRSVKIVYWESRLCLHYGDQYYPLNSRTYGNILQEGVSMDAIQGFLDQLQEIHHVTEPIQYALRWHELLLQFSALMVRPEIRFNIDRLLTDFNDDASKLEKVCDDQFYRLCDWRETDSQINYRRFFLVNGLICLNMQSEKVFNRYHETIQALVKDGSFDGIRVDHIDGLFDPKGYLERLRQLCGPDCYIVVEKILEPKELLDPTFPIQGTTGYEFLSYVNNLFTRNSAENKFSSFYRTISDDRKPINEKIRDKKSFILFNFMKGELANLTKFFIEHKLAGSNTVPAGDVKNAIAEFLIHVPVYRYYGNRFPLDPVESEQVKNVLDQCASLNPDLKNAFGSMEAALLGDGSGDDSEWSLQFYQRCMQFTGPLMAKGVEDTLMYTFNRFVGHNEVGDSPEFFGLSVADFHTAMQERQRQWPLSLNATSTHDTKRGEDARMRLNVLPDIAHDWISAVKEWMQVNEAYKVNGAPDRNDEYFIYQTLMGVYDNETLESLEQRLNEYFTKALREAKRYSDWARPDEAYESAVMKFVHEILQPGAAFMRTFIPLHRKVEDFGIINSMGQSVLKFMCPGIPDIYQGTTGWDLSLVDPDNRRIVDYRMHQKLLDKVVKYNGDPSKVETMWNNRSDSSIKLWICFQLLKVRNAYADVFESGEYIPLEVEGRLQSNCIAFARKSKGTWIVVVVPLNLGRINSTSNVINVDWLDTRIIMPGHSPLRWKHLLWEGSGKHNGSIKISEISDALPLAVLLMEEEPRDREAGVLLSLSSLPSAFGIGDMGPEARKFVDMLGIGRQQIWQLLPLNPTDTASAFSPYSSYSSMAGSELYISPEDLVDLNLLPVADIEKYTMRNRGITMYKQAALAKHELLSKAFDSFRSGASPNLFLEYQAFVEKEFYWLNDFARFEVLRGIYNNMPWHEWPTEIRDRREEALREIEENYALDIHRIKWMQFLFFYQWGKLKNYCGKRSIKLVGDLPFYVSYNSVDVWAHRDLFKIDDSGMIEGIAGVPPDYFAATGQLWGMPVFRWDKLKQQDYRWFIDRLRKNLELFDIVRLDHFRAFADYWEVPRGEETAINGSWKLGPGIEFFEVVKKELGGLPFIAEDLGDISPAVCELLDQLRLPGMKVLQFAFGDNLAASPYIPHNFRENFVVYSGTHDNNTTRGWYRKDIRDVERNQIDEYTGKKLSARNVAEELIRMAYASVAKTAIIPMQDVLNLDEKARMNTPSSPTENWLWRMREMPDEEVMIKLQRLTRIFNR
ncbi:MAG: malto-oligosyltrehalose synthase [Chryseolinea sp.]